MHMDTIIDLRTNPETHNRVILSSIGDEPLDINKYHFLVSADVVQISNMVCSECDSLSTKIEADVVKLFETKKISLNGTKFVKSHLEFLIKTQMLIRSLSQNEDGADVIFENCYFSNHDLHRIISVSSKFDHAYLLNVGFYNNNKMDFGFPIKKSIKFDHVLASEGSVQILLMGSQAKLEQKDCVLPEGAIRP